VNGHTDTLTARSVAWYGKLPSQGDFVGRGMPRGWARTWDDWLQRGLSKAALQVGVEMLRDRLRGMPPWQCIVLPAAPGEPAWCGAVVPSRDRVGRVFPLLLLEGYEAATLRQAALVAVRARTLQVAQWLLDPAHALASLQEFERGVSQLASTAWGGATAADHDGSLAGLCAAWPSASSFWWCENLPAETLAPLAETWPPRHELVLDWIGAVHGEDPNPARCSPGTAGQRRDD
jgi:type VI secretion system ImpM family protein